MLFMAFMTHFAMGQCAPQNIANEAGTEVKLANQIKNGKIKVNFGSCNCTVVSGKVTLSTRTAEISKKYFKGNLVDISTLTMRANPGDKITVYVYSYNCKGAIKKTPKTFIIPVSGGR